MSKPLHILVVDDRPDSVLLLTEFLLARGHRVATAANGQDALDAVTQRQRTPDIYDLLISDVTMPIMDGLTLVRELRRRQISLPVVLYTAYGVMNPALRQQAAQCGVLAMLDKPIELRRVETLLSEVVARRSGTGTARRESSASDQPFFGTARVVRPATARIERSEPDTELQKPTTGALERRRSEIGFASDALVPHTEQLPPLSMPAPVPSPPFPLSADVTPQPLQQLPSAPTPRPYAAEPRDRALVPPTPMRTPLPVAMPLTKPPPPPPTSHQPAGQPPPFRTPIPGVTRTDGFQRPASMRTPLPFLTQPPAPPDGVVPPPPAPIRTPRPDQPVSNNPGNQVGQYPTTSFVRRSVDPPVKSTGYVRRPSGLFLLQPDQPGQPPQPTTSRIRRGVTGSHLPPPTSRFTAGQPPPATGPVAASRAVACAHCRRVFMVVVRRESYTAVCAHCGLLNRIDPL